MRRKGKIKFYNEEKKFGFIEGDNGEKIHFGRDSFNGDPPKEEDLVEFDIVKQERGFHAKNLKIIKDFVKLPLDTRTILDVDNIDNFNLKLNKAARFDGNKFKFFETDRGRIKFQIKANFSKEFIQKLSGKYYGCISKLNLKFDQKILKTDWRMVVGLGNESVYETSMTLHHIYGIPYIPASAIKGFLRNYFINEYFSQREDYALMDEGFCKIFGSPKNSKLGEKRGDIIFFDAYPLEVPKIEPDVMNVHYPDYYGGNKPPADYQNPNPIFFLTVSNTKFKFIFGKIKNRQEAIVTGKFKGENILNLTFSNLIEALAEYGIGAKTAIGYGIMGK